MNLLMVLEVKGNKYKGSSHFTAPTSTSVTKLVKEQHQRQSANSVLQRLRMNQSVKNPDPVYEPYQRSSSYEILIRQSWGESTNKWKNKPSEVSVSKTYIYTAHHPKTSNCAVVLVRVLYIYIFFLNTWSTWTTILDFKKSLRRSHYLPSTNSMTLL